MKKLITIIIVLLVLPISYYSQWIKQSIATTNIILDIQFVNKNVGYCSDDHGKIFRTKDKGLEWVELNSGTDDFLNSISFVDEEYGWAIGTNTGIVINTPNGGDWWRILTTGIGSNLRDIQFVNREIGWIVGDEGQIYKTIDRGSNWERQSSNTSANLWSVFFLNENIGYVAGVGVILKTSNGGSTWDVSYQTDTTKRVESFKSIHFADSSNGWAVGEDWENGDGSIIHTNDGGVTWSFQNSGVNGFRLQSVHFVDDSVGFACGGEGTILSTSDAGSNWYIEETGTTEFFRDIYAVDNSSIYAVGVNGTILSNSHILKFSNVFNINEYIKVDSIIHLTWNSQLIESIKIEYTTDAEKSWSTIEENIPALTGFYDWTIPNTPSVYCRVRISEESNILRNDVAPMRSWGDYYFTIFGKNKWEIVSSPTTSNLTDIKFIDDMNGIAWGNNILIETTNGGVDWSVRVEFESKGASFIDRNEGWVINHNYFSNDSSYVLHTLDGGLSWDIVNSISNSDQEYKSYYNSISFVDSKNGLLSSTGESVGPTVYDILYKTFDNGFSWERLLPDPDDPINYQERTFEK